MERSLISEWELSGDYGVLTINNPPQNYLKEFRLLRLEDLQRWTAGDSLKGMIITGKGRHFCGGFDKEDLFRIHDGAQLIDELKKNNEIPGYLESLPIPVVAAIKGVCLGAGLELALSCHVRVCSEKALLSFPETGYGIIPGLNGAVRLPGKISTARAMEIVLRGDMVHADEALALGLVDHVVPAKEVLDFSLDVLEKTVGDKPAVLVRTVMQSLNNARTKPFSEATAEESSLFARLALDKARREREAGEKMGMNPN